VSEFVDTNVIVRLLARDDAEKANRSFELFQRANNGDLTLTTSEAVVAETVFVLASSRLYGTPRGTIARNLGAVLAGTGLRLENKDVILEALAQYGESNLHFVDCLCVAHARRSSSAASIYSYDSGLDRVPGIIRLEP
jgi:predicted nucleic acid-binding protein